MTRLALALAILIGLATPCAAAPLEVYGRLPAIEAIALSPNGGRLAVVTTNGEQRQVVVRDLASSQVLGGVGVGDMKVRGVQWATEDKLLITSTSTAKPVGTIGMRSEFMIAHLYDVPSKSIKRLMQDVGHGLNVIVRQPEIRIVDGAPLVILSGIGFDDFNGRGRLTLYKLDLANGKTARLQEGEDYVSDWLLDATGRPFAKAQYDPRNGRWALLVNQRDGWRTVHSRTALDSPPNLIGLGRDGASILAQVDVDGEAALQEVSLADGAWGEPIKGGAPIFDPVKMTLIGVVGETSGADRYTFFDPAERERWEAVARAFPGQTLTLVSTTRDRSKAILAVDSPKEGPAYALVDLPAQTAALIGRRYRGLQATDIAPVRTLALKAKDGLAMTGYLTLPIGRDAKNLPLVVFPHGGPEAHDDGGFDWWAQAMASRGYAVLQVNYRGSSGYGGAFTQAGFGEWGRKMQTDLSDAVRQVVSDGVVDPKRVCIVGASYGGYAALAGATLDKGVYRCAASVAGPSDLRQMIEYSRTKSSILAQRYWTRFMGVENASDPKLNDISPVMHAAGVDVPVLLIHGRDDTVVPITHSQVMADALKKAGKPVEFITLDGEDHWLTRGDTRLQMLQAVVAFLEKHNPPS